MKTEKTLTSITVRMRTLVTLSVLALTFATTTALTAMPSQATPIFQCMAITQSGSFVLANNLFAGSSDCLTIKAEFVTIDLDGFLIVGNGVGIGIGNRTGLPRGITVRNGTISQFGVGIFLRGNGSLVEKVKAFGNSTGINVLGTGVIRDNIADGNGLCGICGDISTVIDNTARNNGGPGISVSLGIVRGNFVTNNADGIIISVGGSSVSGNTALANNIATSGNHTGISVACPSNVSGNTATANVGGNLILKGDGCNIIENLAQPGGR